MSDAKNEWLKPRLLTISMLQSIHEDDPAHCGIEQCAFYLVVLLMSGCPVSFGDLTQKESAGPVTTTTTTSTSTQESRNRVAMYDMSRVDQPASPARTRARRKGRSNVIQAKQLQASDM